EEERQVGHEPRAQRLLLRPGRKRPHERPEDERQQGRAQRCPEEQLTHFGPTCWLACSTTTGSRAGGSGFASCSMNSPDFDAGKNRGAAFPALPASPAPSFPGSTGACTGSAVTTGSGVTSGAATGSAF